MLGVDAFVGDLDTAADLVMQRATSGGGGYVCLCNVHLLMLAQRDDAVRTALRDAALVFPDGAPVAWLERRVGCESARRVAGAELMAGVLDRGRAAGLQHYLFGSTRPVLANLVESLESRYPELEIAGAEAPRFDRIEEIAPPDDIGSAGIVWCALGAPKQELWMQRFAKQLAPAVVVGVGAAFDFLAGTKKRAPVWMQRRGLEWLHRLSCEPHRLAGRYVTTNSQFLIRASAELARRRLA